MTIYAVNGKEPVAAWIPSLDTAGNGTTTLTDLVGSNNGTLTNMDAATDWVADTGAGGVRALDCDGVNDHIVTTLLGVAGANARTVSLWVKVATVGALVSWGENVVTRRMQLGIAHTTSFGVTLGQPWIEINGSLRGGGPDIRGGTWRHVVYWYNGGAITTAKIWVDGVEYAASQGVGSSVLNTTASAVTLAGNGVDNSNYAGVRLDDVRLWNVALDSTDIAYLYNSGNGRGRVDSTTIRRQQRSQQIIS
jgi:hypothetical protein